jgi:hypothetical protein
VLLLQLPVVVAAQLLLRLLKPLQLSFTCLDWVMVRTDCKCSATKVLVLSLQLLKLLAQVVNCGLKLLTLHAFNLKRVTCHTSHAPHATPRVTLCRMASSLLKLSTLIVSSPSLNFNVSLFSDASSCSFRSCS